MIKNCNRNSSLHSIHMRFTRTSQDVDEQYRNALPILDSLFRKLPIFVSQNETTKPYFCFVVWLFRFTKFISWEEGFNPNSLKSYSRQQEASTAQESQAKRNDILMADYDDFKSNALLHIQQSVSTFRNPERISLGYLCSYQWKNMW